MFKESSELPKRVIVYYRVGTKEQLDSQPSQENTENQPQNCDEPAESPGQISMVTP